MKTKILHEPFLSLSPLRMITAAIFVLAAAGLAAKALQPPKLPWAEPTIPVGTVSQAAGVDPGTNTIYVANAGDNSVSVIDGSKCSAKNASRCATIATMSNVGPSPIWVTFDRSTGTLYVTNGTTTFGTDGNTIAVLNAKICNSKDTSGCNQVPVAVVTTPGFFLNANTGAISTLALDTSTHTLYAGDAHDGPASMINTATCNAISTGGCSVTPSTMTNGDAIAIDGSTNSVYITDANDLLISVLNETTCNSTNQSGCPHGTSFSAPFTPLDSAVDSVSHTLYVPMPSGTDSLGFVGLFNVSACSGTVRSGCGVTPPYLVHVGSLAEQVTIDSATKTVYILSEESSSISLLNAANCNAGNQSGCPQVPPALATGINPVGNIALNSQTHTLYVPSQDSSRVWVFDASECNAMHTSDCTNFEPVTIVGAGPVGVAANPSTKTVYVPNQDDNTVSVIDTSMCNEDKLAGCSQTWKTINVGNIPRRVAINKTTNTIYVGNNGDGTLSVINGATCNGKVNSSCTQVQPTTTVGNSPEQLLVDEATNTIYVTNVGDGTVSVLNGSHCNGTDTSACGQPWPTFSVGTAAQGLAFNPTNHTLYVANRGDGTVSVVSTRHCFGSDTSACNVAATVPVGSSPRAIGVLLDTNTVFVGDRNDLTVSIFDGATCNGSNVAGCPQVSPAAVLVGAFPSTGGNGNNLLGRSIGIDQKKHIIFVPVIGDSDVAVLDGNSCRAGQVNAWHVKIVPARMGGFPIEAAVDESSGTVYVSNNTDGTVSIFPSSF